MVADAAQAALPGGRAVHRSRRCELAAAAAVVGVVVAEISTGVAAGVGRLDHRRTARRPTSDPAKVYTAVFGAAALGLGDGRLLVALIDRQLMRRHPPEEAR